MSIGSTNTDHNTTDSWQRTACILCSINCGIKVHTDGDRRITKIVGDKEHPISRGYVCEKAQRLDTTKTAPTG